MRPVASLPIGSLWEASAPPDPADRPLAGDHKADICIIGAGFTGLWAAMRLVSGGASIIVLDAIGSGFGASGRNGGQVLPGFKWDPDELVARYGSERGERLTAFAGAAPDLVYQLVAEHATACALRRNCGWLKAAVDGAAFSRQISRAEQWARRGAAVRAVERAEARDLLGTERYCGALLDERAGALNPLAHARGLAKAAQRHGVRVHGGSQVRARAREGGRWQVQTAFGSVAADTVLLCTNGYTDHLFPGLAKEIIPINSLQVATEPLADGVRRTILPQGHVVSDTQLILRYFQIAEDGRLIIGGRGSLGQNNRDSLYGFVENAAIRQFPQLGVPRWQYRWAGKVALTADHMPRVRELAPGLRTCLGYNGRGVAMATAMGWVLADWILKVIAKPCRCRRRHCVSFPWMRRGGRSLKSSRPIFGCATNYLGKAGKLQKDDDVDEPEQGSANRRRDRPGNIPAMPGIFVSAFFIPVAKLARKLQQDACSIRRDLSMTLNPTLAYFFGAQLLAFGDCMVQFTWHSDEITRATPITKIYRNTQNVRRFFQAECDDKFKFDRAFMAWLVDGTKMTMGDAADEWLRRAARNRS